MPKNNPWKLEKSFILASGSPQRRHLLEMVGLEPEKIISADIDESPYENEIPVRYVGRIATLKAEAVSKQYPDRCILAADTIIAVGRRMIRKAHSAAEAKSNLELLSGRRHQVITGFCVISPDGNKITRTVKTSVIMKNMDVADINAILNSEEWKNVAGYRMEGILSACVRKVIGSYPNIIGLPIFEVAQVLKGLLRHK